MTEHKYNQIHHTFKVVRSAPNPSDVKFATAFAPLATLAPSVDLESKCPPVYDQGDLGSCTGNAIAGAYEFDMMKQGEQPMMPSRLFIYYNERLMEGDVGEDAGAQISDGIRSISSNGVCSELVWPYVPSQFTTKPNDAAYADAAKHKALKYYTVDVDVQSLKQALAQGFPVVAGIMVFPEFESEQVATTGMVPMPSPYEQPLGGHAVVIVGYNDATQRIKVRNSWGPEWGARGYFTLPYSFVIPVLMTDLWVVQAIL